MLRHYATKADFANLKTWIVGILLVAVLNVVGTVRAISGCCSDWIDRVAELDARRERGFEIMERFGRAFRDQTAEEIEEAVAQAVAEVRAENRGGAEGQLVPE